MTVTVGRGTTSQQRRESAAVRFSAMAAVLLDTFDADITARRRRPRIGAQDLYRLRGVVRALLPLALDDPTFDVTVTGGPTGVAVRIHHPAGLGLVAGLVAGSAAEHPPAPGHPPGSRAPQSRTRRLPRARHPRWRGSWRSCCAEGTWDRDESSRLHPVRVGADSMAQKAWMQTSSAARRIGDLLGPGVVAAVIVAVVLLGALIGDMAQEPWQLVSAVLLVLVLVAAVGLAAARLLQPIRALSRDVDRAATETLPALAAALQAGAGADALPGVAPIAVRGPREVIALGGAVTSLNAGAVSLAMQEHDRHRRTRDLTTHLARRDHGLVDRLVTQISELETAERSPSVLTQLSRLKHTATRTRRHAESMLVLTGALPDRTGRGRQGWPTYCAPRWPGSRTTAGSTPTSNRRPSAARSSRTWYTWWPSSSRTAPTSRRLTPVSASPERPTPAATASTSPITESA